MGHFTEREIKLHDGRKVTITAYGAADLRKPFFYLHGFPGSRIEGEVAHIPAKALGISIIAFDRPGFGGTASWPRRTLAEFPPLLKAVAEELGIARFGLLAVSGGAPYALAAAAALPEQVSAVGIVSGMGPLNSAAQIERMILPNRLMLLSARAFPPLAYAMAWSMATWWRYFPNHMVIWLRTFLKGADREVLSDAPIERFIMRNLALSLAQGSDPVAKEVLLLARPWNVDLSAIKAPVIYWHGDADDYVPLALAQASAGAVPSATLKILPGQGHFMVLSRANEILTELGQI